MIFDHHDSTTYLKEVFSEKARGNPQFSLRAFALKLGLAPGSLHKILNRQKKLSFERAHEIAKHLVLSGKESEYFVLLVQLENTKNVEAKAGILERLKVLNPQVSNPAAQLTVDHFKMISDWYGPAVLEVISSMVPRGGKQWTASQIAKAIGVSQAEVESTIERLLHLELVERKSDGSLVRVPDSLLIASHAPNEAIRNYYRGVLTRNSDSITTQTPQEKVIGTEVFAFDPEQLDAARELTDRYLTSLRELANAGQRRSELYQAFTNLFRLSEAEAQTKTVKKPNSPSKKSPGVRK